MSLNKTLLPKSNNKVVMISGEMNLNKQSHLRYNKVMISGVVNNKPLKSNINKLLLMLIISGVENNNNNNNKNNINNKLINNKMMISGVVAVATTNNRAIALLLNLSNLFKRLLSN